MSTGHTAAMTVVSETVASQGEQPSAATMRWVTSAVLRCLALNSMGTQGLVFSVEQLDQALAGGITHEQRVTATTKLCALGFLKQRWVVDRGERVCRYTVTAEGAAAIEAARHGQLLKGGPREGGFEFDRNAPGAFKTRLWALLRMRRMITAREGATLLCDAGSDIKRARETAANCLNRWAKVGAVQASERRVRDADAPRGSNGDKRYVLLVDSVEPPTLRRPGEKKARASR